MRDGCGSTSCAFAGFDLHAPTRDFGSAWRQVILQDAATVTIIMVIARAFLCIFPEIAAWFFQITS
jgi:hypothetical protein